MIKKYCLIEKYNNKKISEVFYDNNIESIYIMNEVFKIKVIERLHFSENWSEDFLENKFYKNKKYTIEIVEMI